MSGQWTVPAVELVRGHPKRTAVLIADGGRASASKEVERLLKDGYRVLAVDPFFFGESKIAQRDYLFALLVAAVGDRPLGIQASQLSAIARWLRKERPGEKVTLVSSGPRTSLMGLVAAALEQKAVAGVEMQGSLGSLREIITNNWSVNERPELFCFGLLKEFDLQQIKALIEPRSIAIKAAPIVTAKGG